MSVIEYYFQKSDFVSVSHVIYTVTMLPQGQPTPHSPQYYNYKHFILKKISDIIKNNTYLAGMAGKITLDVSLCHWPLHESLKLIEAYPHLGILQLPAEGVGERSPV